MTLRRHYIPLPKFSQMTGDCFIFNFLRRSVNGKHLMRSQSETSVFNFLWCGMGLLAYVTYACALVKTGLYTLTERSRFLKGLRTQNQQRQNIIDR